MLPYVFFFLIILNYNINIKNKNHMKKTTTLILLLSALLFSCKKESVTLVKTDFQLNEEIDKKISDNILTLSHDELTVLAQQKYEVLYRIKTTHPSITFEQLYPNAKVIYAREGDCTEQFNKARRNCTIAYVASAFVSTGTGFLVGWLLPPVGVAIGATGVAKDTYNYAVCMKNADDALKHCK